MPKNQHQTKEACRLVAASRIACSTITRPKIKPGPRAK